jgi:hypothetical protein
LTWELDGLQTTPRCLGPSNDIDLATCATPSIQERMQNAASNVNLLAVCQTPKGAIRKQLIKIWYKMLWLNQEHQRQSNSESVWPDFDCFPSEESCNVPGLDVDFRQLELPTARQGDWDFVEETKEYESWDDYPDIQNESKEVMFAHLGKYYKGTWLALRDRYLMEGRAELIELGDDNARVEGRKKDGTLVLHEWLKRLALAGKLQEVLEASQ